MLKAIWDFIKRAKWLWPWYCWDSLRTLAKSHAQLRMDLLDARNAMEVSKMQADIAVGEFKMLRSQVMQLRVGQAQYPRTGWEIMAYIPNEVVDQLRRKPELRDYVVDKIVTGLVTFAIKGIVNVSSQGRVSALVFEPLNINEAPRAPRWVQALYEKDGKCTLSPRAHIIEETEEQRVRRASQ